MVTGSPTPVGNAHTANISGDVKADFWRCFGCKALITKIQMDKAFLPSGNGIACKCGSNRFTPANLPWYGWFLPRVLKFAALRITGQA